MIYIAVEHNEQRDIVQYAYSKKQALHLIKNVMPQLKLGYKYVIIN